MLFANDVLTLREKRRRKNYFKHTTSLPIPRGIPKSFKRAGRLKYLELRSCSNLSCSNVSSVQGSFPCHRRTTYSLREWIHVDTDREVSSKEGLQEAALATAAVPEDVTAEHTALGLLLLQVNLLVPRYYRTERTHTQLFSFHSKLTYMNECFKCCGCL